MGFTLDAGNTAWLMTSAALVLLMTPGLAFFYGGMVRSKSVLNMMMMSFGAIGVVTVLWVVVGYSMSFGSDVGGFIGNPSQFFGLENLTDSDSLLAATGVPALVAVAFQATFAIITVALVSGAIADRAKFSTWLIFTAIWTTVVYNPLAHMVWGGGWLGPNGFIAEHLTAPIDFAGGTVVHINAGIAGLALALILGKRQGFGKEAMRPHNLPFVMLGAGLLWFGWFGFNAGSAGAANEVAGLAWVNTLVATAAACLAWLLVERLRDGHATSLGAASGIVAGLVAITPAAGALSPLGSIVLGVVAGVICALAVSLKYRFGYDDSLDVVGVHLVGGIVGTLGVGFLATETGLFYGGGINQLLAQGAAAGTAIIYSLVMTTIIGLVLHKTIGFRIDPDKELEGVDVTTHGETAYDIGPGAGRRGLAGLLNSVDAGSGGTGAHVAKPADDGTVTDSKTEVPA